MDIETIQKINNLALDLMRQGLAQTRDEAVAQAERVYYKRDNEAYTSIRKNMEELAPAKTAGSSSTTSELSPTKINEILEQNTKFMVKTIKEFQEKITQMEKEIAQLRTAHANLRSSVVTERLAPEKEATTPSAQKPAAPASSSHPRSGNYKDADVSIEKFFYMGHK